MNNAKKSFHSIVVAPVGSLSGQKMVCQRRCTVEIGLGVERGPHKDLGGHILNARLIGAATDLGGAGKLVDRAQTNLGKYPPVPTEYELVSGPIAIQEPLRMKMFQGV